MKVISFSILVIALVLVLDFTPPAVGQDPEVKWSGPKWEYLVLRIDDRRQGNTSGSRTRSSASEEKLNTVGEEGWELVSVRSDGTSMPVFYFKRKKS